jgi:hypothetical protein
MPVRVPCPQNQVSRLSLLPSFLKSNPKPEKQWSAMQAGEVKRENTKEEPAFPYTDAGCAGECRVSGSREKHDG